MPFRLAINMPGAISAGAYTAGVLDFLIEALDAWYENKRTDESVPRHDVLIEAFTGASAGGMCAAISAVLLQSDFQHVTDTSVKAETNNRFYESWVNRIDIRSLLKTDDLINRKEPLSALLNSDVIDSIATYALGPMDQAVSRPYVSPHLTLLISLTNLRGVPYSLNSKAPASVEETTFFYGDRIRFETTSSLGQTVLSPQAHPICLSAGVNDPSWDLLRTAAMATGAFPAFLAPRVLERSQNEYAPPLWASRVSLEEGTPPPAPTFPAGMPLTFDNLYVDGGVTNNDPFNYARDFLGSGKPLLTRPEEVDCAVISIAPFPTTESYSKDFDCEKHTSLFWTLPRLLQALISQSRFFGEALSENMSGTTFSSFIVAPSDDELVQKHVNNSKRMPPALQCAALGAFGGFFERGFRAHDFALGRRNCQKFLRDYLTLPISNPLIANSLPTDDIACASILARFGHPGPSGEPGTWLPLVPLCGGKVTTPIDPVERYRMSGEQLRDVVQLIERRMRAVLQNLVKQLPFGLLRLFLEPGCYVIPWIAKRPLRNVLRKQLGESIN